MLASGNAIIIAGENWHHGVIGIVNKKITDLYFKPSILLCYEDDLAKGSGRSVQEVNALLKRFEDSKRMMQMMMQNGKFKMPF